MGKFKKKTLCVGTDFQTLGKNVKKQKVCETRCKAYACSHYDDGDDFCCAHRKSSGTCRVSSVPPVKCTTCSGMIVSGKPVGAAADRVALRALVAEGATQRGDGGERLR